MNRAGLISALLAFACALDCRAQADAAGLSELIGRARAEQVRGDLEAAERDYQAAIRMQPHALEGQINLGLVQYERKKYAASASTLEPVALGHKDEFVSKLFSGLDQLALHHPAKAAAYLEKAEALRPADPQVPLALARAYAAEKQYARAIQTYHRASKLDPSNGDVLFETGMSYLGEVETLSRDLLEVSPPNSVFVNILLGDALMDQHRYNEALKVYSGAEGSASLVDRVCLAPRRGFALFGSGDLSNARQLWESNFASPQRCPLSYFGPLAAAATNAETDKQAAAQIGWLNGQQDGARASSAMDAAWSVRILPKEAAARLTERLQRTGLSHLGADAPKIDDIYPSERTGAAPALVDGVQRASASPKATPARACQSFANTKVNSPPSLRAARYVSRLMDEGRLADAAECANAALQLTPRQPELLFLSIRVDEQLASEALELFRASAPDAPRTHLLLGDMDRQRGDLEAAEGEYRIVLASDPHNLVANIGLAIAYLRDGRNDQAIESARTVLAQDATSAAANQILGEALVAKHQFAEAEMPLREALLHGVDDAPHLHALLGRAEAGLGNTTTAIQELELGSPSDVDGSVHFQLSRLYRQAGNQEAARKAADTSNMLIRQRMDRGLLEAADRTSSHADGQP